MTRESQRRETIFPHRYSQFLAKLTNKGLLRPLAGFDFATRKLPQSRHGFAGRPLRDQHPPIGIDQGAGGDEDKIDGHGLLIASIGLCLHQFNNGGGEAFRIFLRRVVTDPRQHPPLIGSGEERGVMCRVLVWKNAVSLAL